jgi:hypothetical protein
MNLRDQDTGLASVPVIIMTAIGVACEEWSGRQRLPPQAGERGRVGRRGRRYLGSPAGGGV